MKKRLCICLAVLCAFAFSACSGGAPSGSQGNPGPVLGYICKDLSQQWFAHLAQALTTKAVEKGAAEVVVVDAEMSSIQYLIALDNLISRNVDCIIVCPPDQRLGQITAEKCAQAGIPLIAETAALYDAENRLLAPAIAPDAYASGLAMGRYMAAHLLENNHQNETVGLLCLSIRNITDDLQRYNGAVDGFLEKLPNFPMEKIFYANYDGTAQNAFNAAAAVITANPGIHLWVACAANDEGAQSICQVLTQSEKAAGGTVVGMGGNLANAEFETGSCFRASLSVDADLAGAQLAEAALLWVSTGQHPWRDEVADDEIFARHTLDFTLIQAA